MRVVLALMVIGVVVAAGCGGSVTPRPPASGPVAIESSPPPTSSEVTTRVPPSSDVPAIVGSFDIGGRSLYLDCVGAGTPTLILEPGDGGSRRDMAPLVSPLAASHRVCTYERAGKSPSDPAPVRRPYLAMADDLDALLAAAGVDGPFALVGTSLGASAAYLFAVTHPDDVVGFIAINPPPDPDLWLPAVKPRMTDAQYADEVAYGDGSIGEERYDARGWLDVAQPPDTMPYWIVDSSNVQCDGDPICLKVYDVIIEQTKDMASRGARGIWVQIPGSHQLQLSNPADVLGLVDQLLAGAAAS